MSDDQDVILVDENDNQIGTENKLKAHQEGGKLHRAFSVFIFNSKGETLLQQRASVKYHAPLIWSNACCSHPFPGEPVLEASHRRLREELGFDCPLDEKFTFIYREPVGNDLTEYEFDHVIFGNYEGEMHLNKDEVETVKWISLEELSSEIERNSDKYSPWLRICLPNVIRKFETEKSIS